MTAIYDNDELPILRRQVSRLHGVKIAKIERDPNGSDWLVYGTDHTTGDLPTLMAIISADHLFDCDGNYFTY